MTGQDLSLIHARYDKVLKIFKKENCSLAHAMELYGVARNTLRDFIGICELKIKDKEKYQTITAVERDRSGKPAVRTIEMDFMHLSNSSKLPSLRELSEG